MHEFIEDTGYFKLKQLFFIHDPIKLCKLPYPGHPNGCPNIIKNLDLGIPGYKKNTKCPPFALKLDEKYNLKLDKYLVYVKFNIKKQKEKMKLLHPEWSNRQCKCLLYWQKSVVKELRKESCNFVNHRYIETQNDYNFELIPEAMGLHVFETAEYHGIKLEKHPENYIYKITFIGVLK